MNTNKMREQFEAYALDTFGDYHNKAEDCLIRSHDTYVYGLVHTAWLAWQASRETLIVELPKSHESYGPQGHHAGDADSAYYADEIVAVIEAHGIKVAP
jgi:hypothetical protein